MTMARERYYPDERVGPFPTPPARITDGEGRPLEIVSLEDSASVRDGLTRMYRAFDPADRAQGIPPTGEDAIREWLDPLLETGVNVGVSEPSGDPPYVGHAVLVPDPSTSETDREIGAVDSTTTGADRETGADDSRTTGADRETGATESSTIEHPGDYEWELAIFVLQSHQGAGVGTELLTHLLGEAAARGIEDVWLTVERWNGAALALYERIGFERVGAERFDVEMALRLDPDR